MQSAKDSVSKFLNKDGHHDTTVHQQHAPAVKQEQVSQTEHENATTAIDREIHQDHYKTVHQPIHDSETLPEQHHHKLLPTEHHSYEHDDSSRVNARLAEERSKVQDTHERVQGEKTSAAAPSVAGEHVHHHVHETVQPVIQKQTVEPHVVHKTIPIHEVHHNEAQHHAATSLPPISMEEYKNKGGVQALQGKDETLRDQFHGCPPEEIAGHKPHTHDNEAAVASNVNDAPNGNTRDVGDSHAGDRGFRDSHKHDPALAAATAASNGSTTSKKPSLIDRINPKKDADGDGKPGFMK